MSDCLFCGSELPAAEPHELAAHERIAFDPQLGRLWQVCSDCQRWNLTPIEARWEIVEQCERLASSSSTLLRTDRLALLSSGLGQLVRVGTPARVEFAEWRYSSRLDAFRGIRGRLERALLHLPELPVGGYSYHGTVRPVPESWFGSPFIEHGAALTALFSSVPLCDRCPSCSQPLFIHPAAFGDLRFELADSGHAIVAPCGLCGDEVFVALRDARPTMRAALALVSRKYRDIGHVQRAVGPVDHMGGPDQFLRKLARRRSIVGDLPKPARLALWIALDEIAEREALEAEWAYAETLARIADEELTEVPGFEEFKLRVISDSNA